MKATLAALMLCISSGFAYKILCILPVPSKSHDHLSLGIVKPLLKAGHQVTWATPYEKKNIHENLTVIELKEIREFVESVDIMSKTDLGFQYMRNFARNISIGTAQHPVLQRVLVEQQFDAVVSVWFMNEFEAGYAAIQQVPWILVSSVGYHPHLEKQVDQVRSIATVPLAFNDNGDRPMPTVRRFINGLIYMIMNFDEWFDKPTLTSTYESLFSPLAARRGVPLPPFEDAYHNVSILLANSHESIGYPMSLPPNVINIAGYHIEEPAPLPKDLQDLLDGSPQGVIYFSMGSILRSAALKPHTRDALLKLFASLPYTVLWKFEEPLKDLPPNVHVRSWMPQLSILVHKNIRLFITHGGLLSTLEAVYAGVPLLAIPVFGDQPSNAERAELAGYAVKVDFKDDMVPDVEAALKKMLSTDVYYNKVKQISKTFRQRPVPPSDLVNFYIELAIETQGAYHIRSPALEYKWYELWMLDFVLIVLTILVLFITLVILAVTGCLRRILGKKQKRLALKKRN
ncbi:UDP-glycosyltransferase UGT5-like [Spodoptera frugiperda]|uniref:UDP-glucuronosyltransferase n=1 Tax=Spodoptera frugiperda TaxID=7108 RepID=A0A9R0E699_SPOFR|nr:UDP-glycosyltransferase UGT5-like [Spodoptera frugiperda]